MKSVIKFFLISILIISLSYSQDGWELQNSDSTEFLNDVYFLDKNIGWIVGRDGTILNTINGGENWTKQNSGATLELTSVQFLNESVGWIVGDETILYTEDGGDDWTLFEQKVLGNPKFVYFVDENYGWIGGHDAYILKTSNGGKDWESIKVEYDALEGAFFLNDKIGWFFNTYGFYKTEDGGYTFIEEYDLELCNSLFFLNTNLGWIGRGSRSMEMSSVFFGEIESTIDGGATWDRQIDGICIESIKFFDENNGLAIGMIGGKSQMKGLFLKTNNGGETWESQFLDSVGVREFHFIDMNTGWIVGFYGHGNILKTIIGGVTTLPDDENLRLKEFLLFQNYPNPFNPLTMINYQLPITNYVELTVYNLLGQKVTTLVSKKQKAGYHQAEWNASRLSSGVYYYKIEAGEFQDVKKMILLK
jgi:photosystem II stability/assembly factor-like uncharacterized protein